jgi:hypothetical protein
VDRHLDTPKNSANLYQASEFIHFRKRWLPGAHAIASQLPPMPMVPVSRDTIDFTLRKQGKLIFLKNGNSPTELERLWQARLPGSVAELMLAIAEAALPVGLKPGVFHLGDFVADFLQANGYEAACVRDLVIFLSAQLDDYLRRVKSTMIAQALLDFPILVQGSHWEHVDFSHRRAQLLPGQDVRISHRALGHCLGVIDMSANVDSWPHDRVQRAAGAYSLVLTNRQSWLNDDLEGFSELTYEFNADSIAAKVNDVLSHRQRYIDNAIAFGDAFRLQFSREQFAVRATSIAELTGVVSAERRPQIQNFFVWPSL